MDALQASLFVFIIPDIVYGQSTSTLTSTQTPANLSTTTSPAPQNYYAQAPDSAAICTNETATGTGLWCYECKNNFAKFYDEEQAVCLLNLSQVAIRQCGPRDRYCKVERMDQTRQIMTIERGCVEDCYYGCRFNGYGITQMKCTSCCRTPCCNSGNGASRLVLSFMLLASNALYILYSRPNRLK